MKILITGGQGLIGSHLAKQLFEHGHEVFSFDAKRHFAKTGDYVKTLRLREALLQGIRKTSGDIRDRLLFWEILEVFQPEIVVHLAAIPVFNPRFPYIKEMLDVNFHGSEVVFEACAKAPSVRRVIYASSSMAYGNFTKDPQPEDAIMAPLDRYGVSKAASELLLRQTMIDAQKEWIVIRPTSVYGPTDCNNRVIQRFVTAAINNDPAITATVNEALDFTYVEDIANGFALACETVNTNEVYNISAGQARLVTEAAQIVRSRFPVLILKEQTKPADGYRPTRGTLDISKAREKLGYIPQYTLEQGINKYIDFCIETK